MKSIRLALVIALLAGAGAACAFHIPWETMDDYDGVRVVMRVTPDDADVLLNGRFIGAAYEYADSRAALRLASRANELAFRRKGFSEKVVDLRDYPSRRITLRVELAPAAGASPSAAAAPGTPPAAAGQDQAYEAESEPLPPLPPPRPAGEERFLVEVALTVIPEEAAVYIDGRFWGVAPAAGRFMVLRLPPGKYALAAFKPGYAPCVREVTVPKQEKAELKIALEK
ncbi:MAG TPA: PEGA domain-containing protein [Candidatus Aminicenantes bacterium]|nr:PEGA domain-containing protein [Candidatus Aminicenantes bacterium]